MKSGRALALAILALATLHCERTEAPPAEGRATGGARAPLGCAPDCPTYEEAAGSAREQVRGGLCIEYEFGTCGAPAQRFQVPFGS